MNLRGDMQDAANLMNTYLNGADAALNAGDVAQSRSFADKAERAGGEAGEVPESLKYVSLADLEQARDWLAQATRVAVLTGAGISAESGVPTFRGDGGLWKDYKPKTWPHPRPSSKIRAWCGNGTTGGAK